MPKMISGVYESMGSVSNQAKKRSEYWHKNKKIKKNPDHRSSRVKRCPKLVMERNNAILS